MSEEKSSAEILAEKLRIKSDNAGKTLSDEEISKADDFCEGYKAFLNSCKTERECALFFRFFAEQNGFKVFDKDSKYSAGDRSTALTGIRPLLLRHRKKKIGEGIRIAAAHIDSPRMI
jgi:aspartyl aminopeptidase